MQPRATAGRPARRERMAGVVHAMTAVALIAQGLGNIAEPSGRVFAALAVIGAGLAKLRRSRMVRQLSQK